MAFYWKVIVSVLILMPLFYYFFLIPHYKACVASGTDKGVCIETWIFNF